MAKDFDDKVLDPDTLYRRVPVGHNLYSYDEKGKVIFHSSAFGDRSREPSVDRAKLRENNPSLSKRNESDGITLLTTGKVREIKAEIDHGDKGQVTTYHIDVIADPIDNPPTEVNPAHAVISPSPEYKNDRPFKKVQLKLSILATECGWVLPPKEE